MTVAVAVVCTDGIVVAADSRTTLGGVPTRVASDFTHKVFEAAGCAITTWDQALILDRAIAGHMAEFGAHIGPQAQAAAGKLPPATVANELLGFFSPRLTQHFQQYPGTAPPAGHDCLGFLIGGYDGPDGQTHQVTLPSNTVALQHSSTSAATTGAAWRGQTQAMTRVLHGCDLDLFDSVAAAAGKAAEHATLTPEIGQLRYIINFGVMNLQDAVDFAVFVIRTTIDIQRFTHGTVAQQGSWPGVGGPIEIAAVTPAGVQWLQQTELRGERPAGQAELQ